MQLLLSACASRRCALPTSLPRPTHLAPVAVLHAWAQSAAPPGGLASVVRHLKQAHGVRSVYCWHAIMGFWAGVLPPGTGGALDGHEARVSGRG